MKNRFSQSLVVVSLVVIVLCLAVWTKQGQGGRSMAQTWEYKTLVFIIQGAGSTLHEDGRDFVARLPQSRGRASWALRGGN